MDNKNIGPLVIWEGEHNFILFRVIFHQMFDSENVEVVRDFYIEVLYDYNGMGDPLWINLNCDLIHNRTQLLESISVLFCEMALSLFPIPNSTTLIKNVDIKTERAKMKNGLRYDVMNRDGFHCQLCGATGKTAQLVVDHILPVSRGGKTELDNLQTLCFECNSGKRDKVD